MPQQEDARRDLAGSGGSATSTSRQELTWSRRGQVFSNPVTGERAVILTDPETHPDRALVGHLFVRPGGRVAAPHVHPVATERFHVLAGRVGFQISGQHRELQAGESYEVPPGTSHDWWQIGAEEAHVLVEVTPGNASPDSSPRPSAWPGTDTSTQGVCHTCCKPRCP